MDTGPGSVLYIKTANSEGILHPKRVFLDLEIDETISDEHEPVRVDKRISSERQKLVEAEAKQFLAKQNVSLTVVPVKIIFNEN